MTKPDDDEPKRAALVRSGTLHPRPERVDDELFRENPFFDPNDGLQVKYEMLRRVRVDGLSVSDAASTCGLSRPTYYQARDAFEQGGLAGMLPAKKGPRRAHKLTPDVLAFVEQRPDLRPAQLAEEIAERFGVEVHPKSVARVRARARANNDAPAQEEDSS